MKFTKVIRSYMEKTLNEKRCAANKADPETQAYLNRKKSAENEIQAIVDEARYKVREVLDRYGMDMAVRSQGGVEDDGQNDIPFYKSFVENGKKGKSQNKRGSERYKP